MDIKKLIIAFFIVVIISTVIFLLPYSQNQTGNFIEPSGETNIGTGILIIAFSLFIIAAIMISSKRSYYPY